MVTAETVFKDIDKTASSIFPNSRVELAYEDLIKKDSEVQVQKKPGNTPIAIPYWEDLISQPISRPLASIMSSNQKKPSGQTDKWQPNRIEKMLWRRREVLLAQEKERQPDLYKRFLKLHAGTDDIHLQSKRNSVQLDYAVDTVLMHYKRGEYQAAELPCLMTIDLSTALLGAEHPRTLTIISKLASIYGLLGRFEEASDFFSHVVEGFSRVKGERHADTLNCMSNLASMYRCQGRLQEAAIVLRRAIASQTLAVGPQHPNTLISKHELALMYRHQGQLTESMSLFQEVTGEFRRVLGEEHPQTLTASHNAWITRWSQGYHEEAIVMMRNCASIRSRVLGADHPHTKLSLRTLEAWVKHDGRAGLKSTIYGENTLAALRDLPKRIPAGTAYSKTMELGTSD